MSITVSPFLQTNAAGSFSVDARGLWQGTAYDHPTLRFRMAAGIVSSSVTQPLWGGMAISETIPGASGAPQPSLGTIVSIATSVTPNTAGSITGFTVFDANYAMVNTTQSPVPLSYANMQINFYRLGSGQRIAVQMSSALSSLIGETVVTEVSWDYTNQELTTYSGGAGALPVRILDVQLGNSAVVSYNSSTGVATWTRTGDCALIQI